MLVVSGIQEYARRIRELRVQYGWKIYSGVTIKELIAEENVAGLEKFSKMKPDEYVLTDIIQDRDAAFRWNTANTIRRGNESVRDKILKYFQANVGKQVSGEELRYVAGNKTEWARRVRELRTEFGWTIVSKQSGRPDLPVGAYVLESLKQMPEHDRAIPDAEAFERKLERILEKSRNLLISRCNNGLNNYIIFGFKFSSADFSAHVI